MSPAAETASDFSLASYKLAPDSYAEFRRELVIRLSVVVPLLLAGFLYLAWHFDKDRSIFRLVFIPILIGSIVYRQFKDERNKWESLAFEFRDGKLIRKMDRYPLQELVPNEVTAILESPRGITIKTNNRLKSLFLSTRLSDYDAFRNQLISWAPGIEVTVWHPSSWSYVRNFLEILACAWTFGGPLYLMYTSRYAAILPLGIVLSLSMLALILYVRKSPQIPIRAQKTVWILLLLPILTTLSRLLLNGR
ncbi:MAG TPA: hypothetical protein VFF95_09155 [Candidatus Binatus sp.]|jgi:hypothetical protein|nr:hypothetical protein [Candidatus Binatus sp.]